MKLIIVWVEGRLRSALGILGALEVMLMETRLKGFCIGLELIMLFWVVICQSMA